MFDCVKVIDVMQELGLIIDGACLMTVFSADCMKVFEEESY